MKSAHKPVSRREALTKLVRAKAHREGILFAEALQSVTSTGYENAGYLPNLRPRHPRSERELKGRKRLSDSEHLAKTPHFDRPDNSVVDYTEETSSEISVVPRRTDMTISILKIARQAKGKGVAKDFEVVRNVRNVIALPEETERTFLGNDDDWERVYDEEEVDTRKSYSSVLRGNERTR